jgi:hypothetical protein
VKSEVLKTLTDEYGSDLVEVISGIDQIRGLILSGKKWSDPEWLSQAVVKLATLNSFVGEHVAQAFYDAATYEAGYKTARERIKLDHLNKGTTASEAESQKYAETEMELEKWNHASYMHKLLQIKRTDTSELIDTIRSRLSYMKIDKEQIT